MPVREVLPFSGTERPSQSALLNRHVPQNVCTIHETNAYAVQRKKQPASPLGKTGRFRKEGEGGARSQIVLFADGFVLIG